MERNILIMKTKMMIIIKKWNNSLIVESNKLIMKTKMINNHKKVVNQISRKAGMNLISKI